jgi:hypothetical protein
MDKQDAISFNSDIVKIRKMNPEAAAILNNVMDTLIGTALNITTGYQGEALRNIRHMEAKLHNLPNVLWGGK